MPERDIEGIAVDLLNKLSAYKEPAIREGVFAQKIRELPQETVIDVILYVVDMAYRKEGRFSDVMGMFTDKALLRDALGEKGMYRIARRTAEKGYSALFAFMMDHALIPCRSEIDEPLPEPGIGGMPLGLRKSLSKSHSRDTIEKLLYDPDPSVIGILLNNPRTTEADVVKIVSRRPNSGDILRTVSAHERWRHRYAVQCGLAMNPYTPAGIAMRILPYLLSFDLIKIASDTRLPDAVRAQARTILRRGAAV
ncbi:MAG: hypothetical protein M1517_04560 [Deltaproteobacteria bacterium]|nr:hypothetical protein [Deltaproteobacteria bacterium]